MPAKFTKEQSISTALLIGEILLRSGAETYRVEDTIKITAHMQGYKEIQPFVTPTLIMVGDCSADNKISMLRIKSRSTNLAKISAVNNFSYRYGSEDNTYEQTIDTLQKIKNIPAYNRYSVIVATGIASAFFTVMLGGHFEDFIVSIFVSSLAMYGYQFLDKRYASFFLSNTFAGFLVGGLACIAGTFYQSEVDKVIVGAVMPFVPGLAFTNGIRDFLSGDLISGNSRIAEAFMTASSVALGVGIVLKLYVMIQGRWWS